MSERVPPMPANVDTWPPTGKNVLAHLRHPRRRGYLDLRHAVKDVSRSYFRDLAFLEVDSPSFGPPIEEYGNLHFGVEVPDSRQMFLNHSPQFFKQAMISAGYGRVFQFAHCYRWQELDPNRTDQLRGLVQLDFELATDDELLVRKIAEDLVLRLCDELGVPCASPFPILDGKECLEEYGTESPFIASEAGELNPVWVVRSPLFQIGPEGRPVPLRHVMARPTRPVSGPLEELADVRAHSYDLVVRGSEIAGGALRIHEPEAQRSMLDFFGIPDDEFGILFDVLQGAPPHGGIAFGLDRLVAQIAGAPDVRSVNAFPQWII